MDYVFENEVVNVKEVCYFLQNDESGQLYIAHFEDEDAYDLFLEVQGSCVEIFKETSYSTTRRILTKAMDFGIPIAKLLYLQKQHLAS